MRRCLAWMVMVIAMAAGARGVWAEVIPTAAIFNFEMKEGGEEWTWMEKGLADMFTTHFVRAGVPVVARDEMQAMARKMNWVPEMGEKREEMDEIKKQLRISYLVTGVYTVAGEQVTIRAQVINVGSRKEVLRKEISGKRDDVLELEAKLAGQILPFFKGAAAAEALPEVTPWTRSIPAARALYEGMNLFDQGRYGEAWLQFRRAEKQDPRYHDAVYWVARMYYFMDQFEHARLAYERFIYEDSHHPRVADAVKEYLNTYESLNPPAEVLLKLYARMSAAYPDVVLNFKRPFSKVDHGTYPSPMTNQRWLEIREAQLRGELGEHERALEMAAARRQGEYGSGDLRIATTNAALHNQLTGEVILPKMLREEYGRDKCVEFSPERTDVTVMMNQKKANVAWFTLAAPSGYVFKKVHVTMIGEGTEESMGIAIHKDIYADVPAPNKVLKFPEAREKGFLFDNLPRAGFLRLHDWTGNPVIDGKLMPQDPTMDVQGMHFVVELEKLGPIGALDVSCETTGDFRVDVDGRMGRWGSGLVGLLSPGEHTLRFYSAGKIVAGEPLRKTQFGEWTTKVTVVEGHVTKVVGHLPWREDSPWSGWSSATLVGRSYPGYYLGQHYGWAMMSLQLDEGAMRMVWSYMGDLWWSKTEDGATWSAPEKMPLPISTSWEELYPRLLKDESGRYVLTFLSDRSALHERRAYVTWSRDFQHWSAPARVVDRPVDFYDIMQDQSGRFVFVDGYDQRVTVSASRDLYVWKELSKIELPKLAGQMKLLQRRDGRYDLMSVMQKEVPNHNQYGNPIADNVGMFHSKDTVTWSEREELAQLASLQDVSLGFLEVKDREIMAYFSDANRWEPIVLNFQQEKDGAYVKEMVGYGGIASQDATLAYHEKWGYVIAWGTPTRFGWGSTVEGPFVMRGPTLERVLEKK